MIGPHKEERANTQNNDGKDHYQKGRAVTTLRLGVANSLLAWGHGGLGCEIGIRRSSGLPLGLPRGDTAALARGSLIVSRSAWGKQEGDDNHWGEGPVGAVAGAGAGLPALFAE